MAVASSINPISRGRIPAAERNGRQRQGPSFPADAKVAGAHYGTARGHARDLQKANEALSRVNRELEELAFVAGHDLREPLRMVNIYTQLLTHRYGHVFDEEAQQFAECIHRSVARMQRLIDGILDYSQIQHEGRSAPLCRISVREALDHAIALYREQLDAAGASVSIGELPRVRADKAQLALIFQNLLSNALKYAHPERTLRIRIFARQRLSGWEVTFADNGIGFHPEHAERIFRLFKRLHGRDVPGTGLGLAVCRKIVESFGGEIWAESQPSAGAQIIFTLNSSDEENWDDDAAGPANPPGRGQSGRCLPGEGSAPEV